MGVYLNPGAVKFEESLASKIYVDKSGLIAYANRVAGTRQKYICVSRPRRFGKSMAAEMLTAYYQRGTDTKKLFQKLEIAGDETFEKHVNQYNVIFLNIQSFFSEAHDINQLKASIEKAVLWDLLEAYPDFRYYDQSNLKRTLIDIYKNINIPFVFIIDEWDCIFRENQNNQEAQKLYLDFLRNLLKDADYVKLAYMTGILPIKKYGSHSALNMFDEFSMTSPRQLAEFVGFTEEEVQNLCETYHMSFEETNSWYDGYQFDQKMHIYSPMSVVSAMTSGIFGNYWTKTETYEALKVYIEMNFDGLKETIIALLAGERKAVDTGTFTNDMTTFHNVDDILTLLIHLGYLGFDMETKEVYIPNAEIAGEFVSAVKGAGWNEVADAVRMSEELLKATWNMEHEYVAGQIQKVHMETSILNYNDENALAYVLSLAYYSARTYYTIIREIPAGKGFADLAFIPRKNHLDKPAMIMELKWNKKVEGAIDQIKKKEYTDVLREYGEKLLLVGINYNKTDKEHECIIEKL